MFLPISTSVIILLLLPCTCHGNGTLLTVGTVLFSPSDAARDCWNQENIALLTTRMLFVNLMPSVDKLKATDDNFVTDIIEYFRLILEVIRSESSGKTKHILLLAAIDTMGGYMKHLILPVSKYAYYAGSIRYASIMHLYQLYDELKAYLRTDGEGWAKAAPRTGKHIQAKPIIVQPPPPNFDPCKGIIYYKRTESNYEKSNAARSGVQSSCGMEVPLPFFDSRSHPSAIAVPFRAFGLRNLESRVSAYILVKYFVAVTKCMTARHTDEEDIQKFNTNIFSFIISKVMPHLADDKFYAAFGGVLRILQTVTDSTKAKGRASLGNINILPDSAAREAPDETDEDEFDVTKAKNKDDRSRNNLILLAALATIIIWFCLGAAFVCCRIRGGRGVGRNDDYRDGCTKQTCHSYAAQSSSATATDNEMNDDSQPKNASNKSSKASKSSKKTSKSKSSKSTASRNNASTEPETDSPSQSRITPSEESQTQSITVNSVPTISRSDKRADRSRDRSDRSENDGRRSRDRTAIVKGGKPINQQPAPQIQVHSVQYYPPSFACHTSITGRVKLDSSTDEYPSREDTANKRPYIFGYDFQTTSEDSSPRATEVTTDGDNDLNTGNMSK